MSFHRVNIELKVDGGIGTVVVVLEQTFDISRLATSMMFINEKFWISV